MLDYGNEKLVKQVGYEAAECRHPLDTAKNPTHLDDNLGSQEPGEFPQACPLTTTALVIARAKTK